MNWLGRLRARRTVDRDLSEEIAQHLAERADDLQRQGISREEAVRQARRAFGNPTLVAERGRDVWRFDLVEDLWADLRYGWRQLRRSPVFAGVVMATIAVGVGINAAMFSVVNAVLVQPLPFPAPDRLVRLWEVSPRGDRRNVVSSANFFDWREQATSFDAIGAYSGSFGMALTGGGAPVRVETTRITSSAFRVLGVPAVIGREFDTPETAGAAEAAVAVISQAFWRERFGGGAGAVGQILHLNGRAYTVSGVMPEGFDFPTPDVQVWLPATFTADERRERRSHNWQVIGRLKKGVGLEAAAAELNAIAAKDARLYPEAMEGWGVNAVPLHRDLVGAVEPLLLMLSCLALAVLLATCANLASLLLARARRRESEFALRSAIGAGRGRLVRQVVAEVLLLGSLGGAVGVGLVAATLPALVAAVPADIPLIGHVSIDPAVLGFAAALTLLTSLAVGLVPALRVARRNLRPALQSARAHGSARASRARGGLLVAQFALSAALLVAAGLLVQSFARLAAVDYGFDPDRLVEAGLDLPAARYDTQPAQERFQRRLLERIRTLPGVEAAALASDPPLSGNLMTFSFAIEGRPAINPSGREDPVQLLAVSPGYFETLKVPILRGRPLGERDRRGGAPALVVNRALADRFWSGSTAVGQHISFVGAGGPWYEVVGVVGDTRDDGLDEPARPTMFLTYEQRRSNWTWLSWEVLVVRSRPGMAPASLAPSIRDAVWSVDRDLPLMSFKAVDALYATNAARRRFAMQLASGFALVALGLCVFGVYGVVSHSVGEREQEIGVRLALGARPGQVVGPVMRAGLVPAALGTALGTAAAAALTRLLEPMLFAIGPTDAATFTAMIALLLAVASAAAWVPARRAVLIDPASSLRGE